uniref:Uncharacterized protein n=1 Tax=Panagrolaimus davidi TaxID=227884 RepID=A0A914Q2T5_9BILA
MVKQFCEYVSKAFPNLKQLDIEFDYLNHYINNGSAFDKVEPFPKIDPKMFECAQIVKDTSVSIDSRHGRQKFFQKYEIHDGLLFESIVSFGSENGLCWHPFFGYKGVPIGRFSFQRHMYNARNKGDDTIPFRFTD